MPGSINNRLQPVDAFLDPLGRAFGFNGEDAIPIDFLHHLDTLLDVIRIHTGANGARGHWDTRPLALHRIEQFLRDLLNVKMVHFVDEMLEELIRSKR